MTDADLLEVNKKIGMAQHKKGGGKSTLKEITAITKVFKSPYLKYDGPSDAMDFEDQTKVMSELSPHPKDDKYHDPYVLTDHDLSKSFGNYDGRVKGQTYNPWTIDTKSRQLELLSMWDEHTLSQEALAERLVNTWQVVGTNGLPYKKAKISLEDSYFDERMSPRAIKKSRGQYRLEYEWDHCAAMFREHLSRGHTKEQAEKLMTLHGSNEFVKP